MRARALKSLPYLSISELKRRVLKWKDVIVNANSRLNSNDSVVIDQFLEVVRACGFHFPDDVLSTVSVPAPVSNRSCLVSEGAAMSEGSGMAAEGSTGTARGAELEAARVASQAAELEAARVAAQKKAQEENERAAQAAILSGDVCLSVGQEVQAMCRQVQVVPTSSAPPEALASWLCKEGNFFTLFKTQTHVSTLLYSHTNKVLYYASAQAQLSPACPCIGFLCQFTHDTLPEGRVPRLLVFDVCCPLPAIQRGEMLRSYSQHLPQPLCTVQWVGPSKYLSHEFVQGLPHSIEGLFLLGENPLVLARIE